MQAVIPTSHGAIWCRNCDTIGTTTTADREGGRGCLGLSKPVGHPGCCVGYTPDMEVTRGCTVLCKVSLSVAHVAESPGV